ncbi:glycosyltransferase family 2 protein [Aestuariivita boseongensis]|uniref:glycosyltransferase family 2 protein n=1 Tax=Aestuariivita boseongensis TaxID=1470562 RepID=UPI0006810499|nr:glycosyltransferase [Aestuariivita boseongensis]
MTAVPVSIIVVSRGRPAALIRCLTGIAQLRYAPFEVIVVADPQGLEAVWRWPGAGDVKTIAFDEPNISVARNLGVEAAAGDIVAFIDDDAVPEPGWLRHLAAPFQDPSVSAAGGFVRGRNGISWQWAAHSVDLAGQIRPIEISEDTALVLTPSPGRAIKTEGTNMAIRRSVLAQLGGFDPNYHYFLDETDVNLRLAQAGAATAILPLAVVHHGFAENATRRADRVPRDLHQLGASWAVFLSRHCPEVHVDERWADILKAERRRLVQYMIDGRLEPRDVRRIMGGLRRGYEEGLARPASALGPLEGASDPFRPFPSDPEKPIITLAGRSWSKKRLQAQADEAARSGKIPCVYTFSPTTLFHRRRYEMPGYWLQTGGLFGKSLRSDRWLSFWRFSKRIKREATLWAKNQ